VNDLLLSNESSGIILFFSKERSVLSSIETHNQLFRFERFLLVDMDETLDNLPSNKCYLFVLELNEDLSTFEYFLIHWMGIVAHIFNFYIK
jgi:hypothetical protein